MTERKENRNQWIAVLISFTNDLFVCGIVLVRNSSGISILKAAHFTSENSLQVDEKAGATLSREALHIQ